MVEKGREREEYCNRNWCLQTRHIRRRDAFDAIVVVRAMMLKFFKLSSQFSEDPCVSPRLSTSKHASNPRVRLRHLAMDSNLGSLDDILAAELPKDRIFKFSHISTPPYPCAPLYSPPLGRKPERTYCECHFLNVSIPLQADGNTQDVFIVAFELLIYTTKHLTTVFVPKADSTGYLSLLNLPKTQASPLRSIITTYLSYLVKTRQRPNAKLVITLFARAADQYLFPGSVENPNKHVSDDRQLIKWWCRVLDPILKQYQEPQEGLQFSQEQKSQTDPTAQAYLSVPGEESILSFLPSDVRINPSLRKRWKHGHPLRETSSFPAAPPRCLVPHFPDDPKARFLDELDAELPDAAPPGQVAESPSKRGTGQWQSVKTLEQFWEMMAFRHECSSGRLVGFIWIVITPPESDPVNGEDGMESQSTVSMSVNSQASFQSQVSGLETTAATPEKKRKRTLSGLIVPRTPRIKKSASTLSESSLPEKTKYYYWPSPGRGSLLLPEKDYQKTLDHLLKLDFSNLESAAASTAAWMAYVGSLIGEESVESKNLVVVGRMELLPSIEASSNGGEPSNINCANAANVLSVKKRKAAEEPPAPAAGVNMLGAGLVRKKPKS